MSSTPSGPRRSVGLPLGFGLLIALVAVLAYYPVLDNFYYPIDDPLVLWGVSVGADPTFHFRPLFSTWNALLLAAFGTQPFGWYLAGLLVHLANALLVAHLAQRVSGSRIQAAVAGAVFAALYSPNETVLWISANCGLLAVLFVLLAGTAWQVYLETPGQRPARRWSAYGTALLMLAVATGFKEDCVLAGPLLVGLDLCRNGWRRLLRPRSLLVYGPLIALGIAYLCVALRPSLWQGRSGVGEYSLGVGLVPELCQTFAWLFSPRFIDADGWTPASVAVGLALAAALAAAGWKLSPRAPLLLFGLVLALAGMLPVLPGPFPAAGSRYAYAPAIGAAFLVAGAFGWLWSRSGRTPWRAGLVFAMAGWLAMHGLSIHSVEQWRFADSGARLERMVEGSRPLVPETDVALISPPLFNPHDYVYSLVLWCGLTRNEALVEWVAYGEAFLARLDPDADLDPRTHRVYAFRADGEVQRLGSRADAPLDLWSAKAREHTERGRGQRLAVIHLRRSDRP